MQFQFHTGSIKANKKSRKIFRAIRFNSTLVRLKQKKLIADELANQFQFHTGSIKAPCFQQIIVNRSKFQFHTGSIKARSRLGIPI